MPTPYTLHPTPYTLHFTPYTLHPTLYTIMPQSLALLQSGFPCKTTLKEVGGCTDRLALERLF